MLHPSYTELIKVVNSEVEDGETPVVNSRYSIVMATAKRARQIIDGRRPMSYPKIRKPLSIAVDELNKGLLKIQNEEPEKLEEEEILNLTEESAPEAAEGSAAETAESSAAETAEGSAAETAEKTAPTEAAAEENMASEEAAQEEQAQ